MGAGCKKDAPQPAAPAAPEPDQANIATYLALGDSYTIGHGVQPAERYPVQLAKALREKGVAIEDPTIIATTGWTTADLKNGIAATGIAGNTYDLVSLLIGVNNQYQGRSPQEYRREFTELLLQSINYAGGNKENVFVLSIPDWGYTPFGRSRQTSISAEIDEFNIINKQITDSVGVSYYNITPISRNGLSDPSLVASDGLHPSGKMYSQWVDLILKSVQKKLVQ
ncbi:lysophospholipase [Flammeovirgaceae bacterium 311]|nr:lysophospholipase [Flammeovirgaceae bacterium 311]